MNALRDLYYETAILPSEEDFLKQANNHDMVYLVMRWLNLDETYTHFVEEEMDLDAIRLLTPVDLIYFGLEDNELFKKWVDALKADVHVANAVTNAVTNVSQPLENVSQPITNTYPDPWYALPLPRQA